MDFVSVVPIAAIVISVIAIAIAYLNYRRKEGVHIRGAFGIASSVDCDEPYISRVLLENLKDRAATIFSIYLQVGHNFYIEVEDFGDKPLILRAYETYQQEFGPIEFYGVNLHRIDLSHLLRDDKVRKRLVLSTADGKYIVPARIRTWLPVSEMFSNHLTGVITTVRTKYKDQYLGGNIKFVLEIVWRDGAEQMITLTEGAYHYKSSRDLGITRDALQTNESLERAVRAQMDAGKLNCQEFKIVDLQARHKYLAETYSAKRVKGRSWGAFQYFVMGWLSTRYSDWELKRKNKRQKKDSRVVRESLQTLEQRNAKEEGSTSQQAKSVDH